MPHRPTTMRVHEAASFHNHAAGLDVWKVDLVGTAERLVRSGLAGAVCVWDWKAVYLDEDDELQVEPLAAEGLPWDDRGNLRLSDALPRRVVADLTDCLALSFHAHRIGGLEGEATVPHLRAALPPVALEGDERTLSVQPWLTLHVDGIMVVGFQVDSPAGDLAEDDFIRDVVNLEQRRFRRVWVSADVQRLFHEDTSPHESERLASSLVDQGMWRLEARLMGRTMHREWKRRLEEHLGRSGRDFTARGSSWELHQVADLDASEVTLTCGVIHCMRAVASQVVARDDGRTMIWEHAHLLDGRPSVSVMRFADQPASKDALLEEFGPSLARILTRSIAADSLPQLPRDLRPSQNYSFHAAGDLLLWTWLRSDAAPGDAWEDADTRARLMENQAIAEHFEYHNMRMLRAAVTAEKPPSDGHLSRAYDTLTTAEDVMRHLSRPGEIQEALEDLMETTGARERIEWGKERARWSLAERGHAQEKRRVRRYPWLVALFGLVAAVGLADLVIQPLLQSVFPGWSDWQTGLAALGCAALALGLLAVPVWAVTNARRD